jgi:23S rRNA pseudouridine1911/1915/1917 synthase
MNAGDEPRLFELGAADPPQRLDRFLSETMAGPSRAKIQRWIEAGCVQVNGEPRRPSQIVRPGDRIELVIPPTTKTALEPEPIALEILYEDDDLLAINKPAGLVVHPAPGHRSGTLVNALLHHCGALREVGGRERPGLVHRLDKETSGVLVVAKTEAAYLGLVQHFKAHTIERHYTAIVVGRVTPPEGEIRLPIGRDRIHRKKISPRTARPKSAVTHYRVVAQYTQAARVDVMPLTGRTHQIRVHMAARNTPVLGDATYGSPRAHRLAADPQAPPITRHLLHAESLALTHPLRHQLLKWSAPLPADMRAVLAWLERVDKG